VSVNTASGLQEFSVQDEASITTAGQAGGQTSTVQELRSLQSLGITAIDYNNGRYEYSSTPGNNNAGYLPVSSQNNGQGTSYGSIQTLTLDASNDGIRYTPVGAGIKIDDSSGESEILITQILSEEALYDSLTVKASGETIGNAGALLYEDGVPFAWNPGNSDGGQGFIQHNVQLNQTHLNTTKRIALCAGSMPGRGLKGLKNTNLNSTSRQYVTENRTVRITEAGTCRVTNCAQMVN
jgi:hypothetical protein